MASGVTQLDVAYRPQPLLSGLSCCCCCSTAPSVCVPVCSMLLPSPGTFSPVYSTGVCVGCCRYFVHFFTCTTSWATYSTAILFFFSKRIWNRFVRSSSGIHSLCVAQVKEDIDENGTGLKIGLGSWYRKLNEKLSIWSAEIVACDLHQIECRRTNKVRGDSVEVCGSDSSLLLGQHQFRYSWNVSSINLSGKNI